MLHSMAYAFIDTIQSGKKQLVNTFVTNEKLATILETFVDAQTQYTKSAVDIGIKTMTDISKVAISKEFFSGK